MPEKKTLKRAAQDKREGKAPSTQAGEFVREEIEHIREGKHGARSAKQAIAIGLSKARRAGVALPPPEKGTTSEATRERAKRALKAASKPGKPVARARSHAACAKLKGESPAAASKTALSRHAKVAARMRTAAERSAAARKVAKTRGSAGGTGVVRKAARSRQK